MTSYTNKLSLAKPALSEPLDALVPNWDRLDQNFSGAMWVLPGVIPADNLLSDGQLVAEIGNGKVWQAVKNTSTGNYDQEWIKYPWLAVADVTTNDFPDGIANHPWGYSALNSSRCINVTNDDLVGGRIVIPIKGIYTGKLSGRWSQGAAMRLQRLSIGAAYETLNSDVYERSYAVYPLPTCNWFFNKIFNAGDNICGSYWQNSGFATGVTLTAHIDITLVRPLN